MTKEFNVDKNNFKYYMEMFYNDYDTLGIKNTFSDVGRMFIMSINVVYREADIYFFNHKHFSSWDLFNNQLKPMVDRFIESDEKAGDGVDIQIGRGNGQGSFL